MIQILTRKCHHLNSEHKEFKILIKYVVDEEMR